MDAPKLPSFFKAKSARQFEYKPRYYDAAKEEREARNKRIAKELNQSADHTFDREAFRTNLKETWQRKGKNKTMNGNSSVRILLIIAALSYLTYYIIFK